MLKGLLDVADLHLGWGGNEAGGREGACHTQDLRPWAGVSEAGGGACQTLGT